MRVRALGAAVLGALPVTPVPAAAGALAAARPVPFVEVSYAGARDLAAEVAAGGSARVELPFAVVWNGARHAAAEVGPGWLRLVPDGEGRPGLLAARPLPVLAPGGEAAGRAGGARFDVLPAPLALGPAARVLVAADAARLAVRWWGLRASAVSTPVAAEIVLFRNGAVRFQYLQVQGLSSGTRHLGAVLRNGLALEIVEPGQRLLELADPGAPGPPPIGCEPPTENWCDRADGPAANAVIFLDSRMEETPPLWTTSGGRWGLNDFATCPPGASTNPGTSAYVGDPATCRYSGAFTDDLLGPSVGPVTATTKLSFTSRMQFSAAADRAEILLNGFPVWFIDPTGLNPGSWYRFGPQDLPAPFAGQMLQVGFRFTSSGTVSQLGWMVDDVFLWDENGANYNCVRQALYNQGQAPYADCGDIVHDDWAFNESEFCLGCVYTFYALVECGTEMHLPLADMEGAEISVQEMITGARPSLSCTNDAQRNPPGPPIVQMECCSTSPGQESWTGPAYTATDNAGPGAVSFGFPACADIGSTYDVDQDGLECSELSPPCGGVLTQLSPGEGQGMDCRIAGNPGLCGIYRIDVRSGGFVWDLFANCTGDTTPNFQLYTSCVEAWAAFNPLPELAVVNVRETGTCPDTTLEFTLQNVGCADHAGDIEVRASSSCPVPDVAVWTVTGGLGANATRTESRQMTVSCPNATVTIFVDPGNVVPECSETGSAAACAVIPGADSTTVSVCGCAGTQPPVPAVTASCAGVPVDLSCGTPVAGATYDWDFEDDGTWDAQGCNVSHTYSGPGPFTARVRVTESGGCQAEATIVVNPTADDPATESAVIRGIRVLPGGLHFEWGAVPKGLSYRVARGTLRNFYDHTVDDPAGIGRCDTLGALAFDDPDDVTGSDDYYYLVAPISNCGTANPWGNGREASPPPPPIPSASCP